METVTIESVVRGYHVNMDVWVPNARERLQLACEPSNVHDCTAVAVKRPGLKANTVGHVPRDISRNVFYFLCNEGTTGHCLIT